MYTATFQTRLGAPSAVRTQEDGQVSVRLWLGPRLFNSPEAGGLVFHFMFHCCSLSLQVY